MGSRPASYWVDLAVLCLLTAGLTWQPYYLHARINLFELGLYLPGIDAILQGQVPFRDFFYLRGPLDLYLAAGLMKIFGANVAVLSTYFYAGTVVTLLACVLTAAEVIPGRTLLYALVPVLVVRTFPRVVFTYWGGLRYAWGLFAVFCLMRSLRSGSKAWIIAAGLLTAAAGLTSPEVGVSAFVAAAVLLAARGGWGDAGRYVLSVLSVLVPYGIYLSCVHALPQYLSAQWVVATQLTKTFLQTEPVPSSLPQLLHALLVPVDKNFRQMTPVYCYVLFVIYLFQRRRRGRMDWQDQAAGALALYGFMIYATGFRNLWANVFEMSLQPEKIVFFYLLGRAAGWAGGRSKKWSYALLAAVVASSAIYTAGRMNKRFLSFRKDPLRGQEARRMELPRLKGMVLPQPQAGDIEGLKDFIDGHVAPGEAVWMYPELGALHFILQRPWPGKFPTATLSWIDERWHAEYMETLAAVKPRFAICDKKMPEYFRASYFPVQANRRKFEEEMQYLRRNYRPVSSTASYDIFERRP